MCRAHDTRSVGLGVAGGGPACDDPADAEPVAAPMTRVTIVGAGTSAPQPETPASGVLVESATTTLLVDCGQGVIRGLMPLVDPRELGAIVVGHMHADHYIDLVSLRYLLPWADFSGRRIPVLLPPGGRSKIDDLARAISERDGFFDEVFEIREYDPASSVQVGDLTVRFVAGEHYVPAWGCVVEDAAGARVVVSGDTGPNERLVEAATGAELLVVEATLLKPEEDDPARGHLTIDEAIDHGARADVRRTVLVHHRPQNRAAILEACAAAGRAILGLPGLVVDVTPGRAVPYRPDRDGPGRGDGNPGAAQPGDEAVGIASSASRARRR